MTKTIFKGSLPKSIFCKPEKSLAKVEEIDYSRIFDITFLQKGHGQVIRVPGNSHTICQTQFNRMIAQLTLMQIPLT